jgi:hypothetical protein
MRLILNAVNSHSGVPIMPLHFFTRSAISKAVFIAVDRFKPKSPAFSFPRLHPLASPNQADENL